MKLDKSQIIEIEGSKLSQDELAKRFNVSQRLIYYYKNPEAKERNRKYMMGWYRKLSKTKKKERQEKYREYQRNYQKTRYHNDPIFRQKQIDRAKRNKKK